MKKVYPLYSLALYISLATGTGPMVVVSIPKCGSFLACKLMQRLTGKKVFGFNIDCSGTTLNAGSRYFYWGHLLAIPNNYEYLQKRNCKILFILRNPLDEVVSYAHVLTKTSYDEVMMRLIADNGSIHKNWAPKQASLLSNINTIVDYYNAFLDWMNQKNVYTTTFEKLVGPKGGGNAEVQRQEIINIANHFSIRLTESKLQEIIDTLFGDSHTFREGQIGSWKKHFKTEHIDAFKAVGGNQLLVDLGYEPI